MEESAGCSQNFCLKLSPYSSISNTQYTSDDDDIIIISDSSSKSTSTSPKCIAKSKSTSKKCPAKSNKIYILDSSDSDSTSNKNENRYFETWKANKKYDLIKHLKERKGIVKRNNVLYTSDESSTSSSEHNKKYVTCSNKTSNSYTSSATKTNTKNVSNVNIQCQSIVNKKNSSNNASGGNSNICSKSFKNTVQSIKTVPSIRETDNSNTCSKSFKNTVQSIKTVPSIKETDNNLKKKFSRNDIKNIIKNIKSTRLVYESPKLQKQNNMVQDKEEDDAIHSEDKEEDDAVHSEDKEEDDAIHPAISPNSYLKTNNKVIDETLTDSESDVIPDSQINLTNHHKTYVEKKTGTTYNECELSERKRKEISRWLMANTPDSQSNSSFSAVPPSTQDNVSSGNSSLERLEMNYETPNNRGRIRQQPVGEKETTNSNYNKTPHTVISRQTSIDEYIQQSKNNAPQLCTSKKRSHTNSSAISTSTKNQRTNAPQKIDVMDYVDILEKLYGKSWRQKADILFPQSEPRKQAVLTKNRAVQTERKKINKGRIYVSDSDDDSNTSLEDLKLLYPLKKKNVRKTTKPRDSFINDEISSESGSESLYYTALTNPRTSTTSTQSKPKISSIVQNVVAICDTDSENENNKNQNNQIPNIRKKLFNNDESDDSVTSEFDPGDDVPPKPRVTKDPIKTSRQTYKLNTQNKSDNQKYEKQYSFLASLSESVPIHSAHPDAKKYRLNFKNNKDDLCSRLYKLYNEEVFDKKLPEDLSIEWNVRMRGTAGFCYNKKSLKTLGGIVKSSRIVLATKILDTPDRLRDTLIHEMCHAAAWLINNVSDGHGPFWTQWANKAMKTFPDLPPIRRCHDYKIKTKFTYKCVGCGYSIGRHSKSLDTEKKRCGHCYGKFELLINKTTKSGIVQVQTPKREPTAFALYIKENYSSVKKDRKAKHGEIMKILSQQFSAIKIAKKQENSENNPDTLS